MEQVQNKTEFPKNRMDTGMFSDFGMFDEVAATHSCIHT